MIYAKNVPTAERAIRVIAGLALIAFGVFGLKGTPLGYVLTASGLVAVLTGFVGFCPMCALAGRRIEQSVRRQAAEKPDRGKTL